MKHTPIPVLLAAALAAFAVSAPAQHPPLGATVSPHRKPAIPPVDINNASLEELKTLPGIGDAEADRIVKGRPYLSKVGAFTKGVLPESAYPALKERIVVREPKSPGLKSAARRAAAAGHKPAAAKP